MKFVHYALFILFYAVSPLWAKAAIYTGITIGIAKARYLLYYAADPRPRTAIANALNSSYKSSLNAA